MSARQLDWNRVSWRDLSGFERTSPTIISAACSSGIQWQAGASEQLGLLGALRSGGTRRVIAPRWDIVAESVLPLIQEVISKHIEGEMPLLDALHETCSKAERRLPRWLAWALCLEGNWQ